MVLCFGLGIASRIWRPFHGSAMTRRPLQPPRQSSAHGILLPLCVVVVFVFAPTSAFASCGDYLHGLTHGLQGPSRVAAEIRIGGEILVLPEGTPPASPGHPGPVCSGPQCRNHVPIPTAPTKSVLTTAFLDAVLVQSLRFEPIPARFGFAAVEPVLPSGPVGRVFRPPRSHDFGA